MARGKKATNTAEMIKDAVVEVEKNIEEAVEATKVNTETNENSVVPVKDETVVVETEVNTDEEIKVKEVEEDSTTIENDGKTEETINTNELEEEKAKPKRRVRYYEDVYGCNWNGQCFDY